MTQPPGNTEHDDQGHFKKQYSPEAYLKHLDQNTPTRAQEVADAVGCSYELAYKKLRELEEEGHVTSQKNGNARVWTLEGRSTEQSATGGHLDRKLLTVVVEHGPVTPAEIAEIVEVPATAIRERLDILAELTLTETPILKRDRDDLDDQTPVYSPHPASPAFETETGTLMTLSVDPADIPVTPEIEPNSDEFDIPENLTFTPGETLYCHVKTPQQTQTTNTYEFSYDVKYTEKRFENGNNILYVYLDNTDERFSNSDRYGGSKYRLVFGGERPKFERRSREESPDTWFKSYQEGEDVPFVVSRV